MARTMHESATEVFRVVIDVLFPDNHTSVFCAGPFSTGAVAKTALKREVQNWNGRGYSASGRIERAETLWEVVE
ncbi:hypothetical protein [Streptomyces sp. NPDC007063]|uniref:hypothetical protein n=1 Tax=Streptomyces sp. NPDC007063 TaxID=3364772 RepID=UPI0036C5D044